MAEDEKPYRVYRGGRQKGKVPAPTLRQPRRDRRGRDERRRADGEPPAARGPLALRIVRQIGWRRGLLLGLGGFLVLFVLWGIGS